MIATRTSKRNRALSATGKRERSRPDLMERLALAMLLAIGAVTVTIALWSVAAYLGLAGIEDPLELMHHVLP
ncbi:MAG TPA: hypothetical protein ENK27_02840 [Desulfobulbus sp.]|nr:hypothetical protein [Desulfobulbus sp.]